MPSRRSTKRSKLVKSENTNGQVEENSTGKVKAPVVKLNQGGAERAAGCLSNLKRVEVYGPNPHNDGSFTLRLAMMAAHCPGCGETREPGKCESCGSEVPVAEELSETAIARREALVEPLERVEALLQSCDVRAPVGPKLTGDQFAGAIAQSDIFEHLDEAEFASQRLSAFDLEDRAVIGTSLRKAVVQEVDRVGEVSDLCLELLAFDVSPPQPELCGELTDACKRVVEMLLCFLEAVSAQTIPEVREAERRLQDAINRGSRHRDLPTRVVDLRVSADLDARIALVTGRPGTYFDEWGFVSPGRVFGVFAGEESPYEHISGAAASYLRHLLPGDLEPSAGSTLILAAVSVASLDRPLRAHRSATAMSELVGKAADVDSKAVALILSRSVEEGPKLFAAASRVRMGMRLIGRASELEEDEEEFVLREVMNSYLEIAESAFRSHAWAVLGIQAVLEGKAFGNADPPMLGSLVQRLRASDSKLAQELAEAVDAELRNAAGHSQYRWDRDAEEVEDLETGRRWSVEELEERTEALGDSVIGVDAGYLCGVIAAGIEVVSVKAKLDPRIREHLVEASFALGGYELVALSQDGATATVKINPEGSLPSLMTTVASMSALVKDADAYRVVASESGSVLLDVPSERMVAATKGPAETRDIEIVQCFTDSEIRTGTAASTAAHEGLVVQTKVIAITALRVLAFEGASAAAAKRIRVRAEAVLDFLDRHPEINPSAAKAAKRRLEGAIADTYPLERGEPKALKEFLRRIRAAFTWADRQGISWPPEFEGGEASS